MKYYNLTDHDCFYKRENAYLEITLARLEEEIKHYKEEMQRLYCYRVAIESLAEVLNPLVNTEQENISE